MQVGLGGVVGGVAGGAVARCEGGGGVGVGCWGWGRGVGGGLVGLVGGCFFVVVAGAVGVAHFGCLLFCDVLLATGLLETL